ncbi:hypothetical protein RX328_17025 [Bradyrhizobium sp. sBnM-33]|nr:hypothetical protein [Bradyrhizobium sp. sBnM-33]WOH53633.1 hypothetical protein RX328_17025 [Bradyrhizobium sp. sBnM-33]
MPLPDGLWRGAERDYQTVAQVTRPFGADRRIQCPSYYPRAGCAGPLDQIERDGVVVGRQSVKLKPGVGAGKLDDIFDRGGAQRAGNMRNSCLAGGVCENPRGAGPDHAVDPTGEMPIGAATDPE